MARLFALTPGNAGERDDGITDSRLRRRRATTVADEPAGIRSDAESVIDNGTDTFDTEVETEKGTDDDLFVILLFLHPLRLLAVVPRLIGTFWLLRNSVVLALRQQDLRRIGDRREPGPLDFMVACLWVSEATEIVFCFHR